MSMVNQERLEFARDFFIKINSLKPSERNTYIDTASRQEIEFLTELFKNFLDKKFTIDKITISRLALYKNQIRQLGKKIKIGVKKKLLRGVRAGFALKILLPLAINHISRCVSSC